MSLNDPLGDLLSRIRNAQMRNKSKVSTPGSKMRALALEVLTSDGYISGYASVEHKDGRSEFEIALKCFAGAPVIRESARVSRPISRITGAPSKYFSSISNSERPSLCSTEA